MSATPVLTCETVRDLAPLFVSGALAPDEMAAVREHLAGCADAHVELLELGEAATALLETVEPVMPPVGLKGRLLAAAQADLDEGRHPATQAVLPVAAVAPVVPPAPAILPAPISLDRERARRRPRLAWLAAAAALIVAIGLGGLNLGLQRDLSAERAYRDGVTQALDLASKPGSLTALLASDNGTVSGLGVVGSDGTVRLAMRGLAGTTGAQVYTAWEIGGDGKPIPIGEFTVGSDGFAVASASAPGAASGAVLALTLEPSRGATAPTLPIVAKGVARGPAG